MDLSGGGSYAHDLTQPAVRAWWIAAATNDTFFGQDFDGVFADNAIANADQLITASGERLSEKAGQALLVGQQVLYTELREHLKGLGGNKTVIFNGIRAGQKYAGIPNLLPHADGGEMEGWFSRYTNGSLNWEVMVPTLHHLIEAARMSPPKEVLLKAVPGGVVPRLPAPGTPAQKRAYVLEHARFPLAAFLVVAGPRFLLDYTYGYRSNMYVPPTDSTGSVPGVPHLQSFAPQGWYPDYRKAPGTPLGDAVFDGAYTFARNWTGVSVSVNLRDETATIRWQ